MKKNLISILLFLTALTSVGYCAVGENSFSTTGKNVENYVIANNQPLLQNYIIFSSKPIQNVRTTNDFIVSANIMQTIMNVRDTLIVNAISEGNAKLILTIEDKDYTVDVRIKNDNTFLKTDCQYLELIPLDVPTLGVKG